MSFLALPPWLLGFRAAMLLFLQFALAAIVATWQTDEAWVVRLLHRKKVAMWLRAWLGSSLAFGRMCRVCRCSAGLAAGR